MGQIGSIRENKEPWTPPVLSQTDEKGLEQLGCYYSKLLGCYYSKKLSKCQQRYSTIEKEGLGLVFALQQFEVDINLANMKCSCLVGVMYVKGRLVVLLIGCLEGKVLVC